jgi:hypothetical protein
MGHHQVIFYNTGITQQDASHPLKDILLCHNYTIKLHIKELIGGMEVI